MYYRRLNDCIAVKGRSIQNIAVHYVGFKLMIRYRLGAMSIVRYKHSRKIRTASTSTLSQTEWYIQYTESDQER